MMYQDMKAEFFDTMLRARKGYSRVLDPICKRWELTRNELDILLFLHNNPGLDRAADIVNHRGIAKSHVSLSVTDLERRGLLIRQVDDKDRRTVHLILTPEAVTAAETGRDAQIKFFRQIYGGLTQTEFQHWQRIIRKVSANVADMEL